MLLFSAIFMIGKKFLLPRAVLRLIANCNSAHNFDDFDFHFFTIKLQKSCRGMQMK